MDWIILGALGLALLILLAFALRAVVCWYFKIDEHLANQKRIIQLLEDLRDRS